MSIPRNAHEIKVSNNLIQVSPYTSHIMYNGYRVNTPFINNMIQLYANHRFFVL